MEFQVGVEPNVGVDQGQSMFGTSNFGIYLFNIILTSAPPGGDHLKWPVIPKLTNYAQVHPHRSWLKFWKCVPKLSCRSSSLPNFSHFWPQLLIFPQKIFLGKTLRIPLFMIFMVFAYDIMFKNIRIEPKYAKVSKSFLWNGQFSIPTSISDEKIVTYVWNGF